MNVSFSGFGSFVKTEIIGARLLVNLFLSEL